MLKNFFKKWLFKEELKDIELLKNQMEVQEGLSNELLHKFNVKLRDIEEHAVSVAKNYIIEEFGECAVDIGMQYDPSWAVISIQGRKRDYIRFIDLSEKDLMEIGRFLKQFERRGRQNFCVDAPHFIQLKRRRRY